MQYILLIYDNEAEAKSRNAEEGQRIFGEYMAFTASVKQSGHMRAGEPLELKYRLDGPSRPASTARREPNSFHRR